MRVAGGPEFSLLPWKVRCTQLGSTCVPYGKSSRATAHASIQIRGDSVFDLKVIQGLRFIFRRLGKLEAQHLRGRKCADYDSSETLQLSASHSTEGGLEVLLTISEKAKYSAICDPMPCCFLVA